MPSVIEAFILGQLCDY